MVVVNLDLLTPHRRLPPSHGTPFSPLPILHVRDISIDWCERGESNPHAKAPDPKSGASTSSATLAGGMPASFSMPAECRRAEPAGRYWLPPLHTFRSVPFSVPVPLTSLFGCQEGCRGVQKSSVIHIPDPVKVAGSAKSDLHTRKHVKLPPRPSSFQFFFADFAIFFRKSARESHKNHCIPVKNDHNCTCRLWYHPVAGTRCPA